jgi:hypothetical protein
MNKNFEVRVHDHHKHINLLFHIPSNTCVGIIIKADGEETVETVLQGNVNIDERTSERSKELELAFEYIGDRKSVTRTGWSTKNQTWFECVISEK